MTDNPPAWLDEPFPLDHSITWREHYARKNGHTTHSMKCDCNWRGPNE